ncbi:MAG: T9SS type A sorting domain-containing protein [Saprospiraceae bacterium]|nr:T9SS type A sorting domain-containing protein [Saprospiraceae bacterium]
MKKLSIFPILILTLSISYGQWTTTNLSEAKDGMGAAALLGSNTFWFAGGWGDIEETNKVEIYNAETDTWTFSQLSQTRSWPAGLAYKDHIFFAGGMFWSTTYQPTSRVDIWNNEASQWSTAELSIPRFSISAVGVGNKALFAGGGNLIQNTVSSTVDIYDFTTGQWTTTQLSGPRAAMGSAVVETSNGPIALFGGGVTGFAGPATDLVEIYHANTDSWSTAQLSEARAHLSATSVGHKVIFAGGITNDNVLSDRVDIYDALTGDWTTATLSAPRCTDMTDGLTKTVCGKVYVVGGGRIDLITGEFSEASNVIDIYDPATDTWSVEYLNRPLVTHSVVSDGNRLLVAGGRNTEFSTIYDEVDIYTCSANAVGESKAAASQYRIYPNPNSGSFFLEKLGDSPQKPATVRVYNTVGELVTERNLSLTDERLDLNLIPGTYIMTILSDGSSQTEKLVIQ